MEARVIEKIIEVEGRRFIIRKYDALTGLKVSKMFLSKVLPMFQSFIPMLTELLKKKDSAKLDTKETMDKVLDNFESYLDFDKISQAFDLITGDDLDYIMKSSLMCCFESLGAGLAQVMLRDGTYGVENVEYDPVLVMRLVCESVKWSLGDFFTGNRLASIMSPLSNS